jgi:hypothetical protein
LREDRRAPALFHVIIARGWAGIRSLLAMVLFEKFGQHQPLNRQAWSAAKYGVPIQPVDPWSTVVAAVTAALMPLVQRRGLRAERRELIGNTARRITFRVPVLASKTDTGRIWVYVRTRHLAGRRGGACPITARRVSNPQAHLRPLQRESSRADAYGGYGSLCARRAPRRLILKPPVGSTPGVRSS